MSTRMILLTLTATFACAAAVTPAVAGDFGISFSYRSSSPRCYTTYAPSSSCVYYGYDPLVYLTCSTPRIVLYDRCYPTTYRTTYSRSYYTRPVRHSRTKVCHHRSHASHRQYYCKPRTTSRSHCYRSSSRSQHHYSRPHVTARSYYRPGRSHCRPSSSLHRYLRPHQRVRFYRR